MDPKKFNLEKLFKNFDRKNSEVFVYPKKTRRFKLGDLVTLYNNFDTKNGVLIYNDPGYFERLITCTSSYYFNNLMPRTTYIPNNSYALLLQDLEIDSMEDSFQLVKILSKESVCYCIAGQVYPTITEESDTNLSEHDNTCSLTVSY